MNDNLTFLLIASNNDCKIIDTINSIKNIGKVLIVDGGPRKTFYSSEPSSITLKEIAVKHNLEYVTNPYEYAARQYNFGINQINTKWTFIIDSDETLTSTLAKWLSESSFTQLADFFYVKRYNYFLDRRMKYGQFRPDWNIRLFRTDYCRYEDRAVHARMITRGSGAKAQGTLNHFTVQNLDAFFLKMIEFSSLELRSRRTRTRSTEVKAKIRIIFQYFPFQASLRFFYSYFFRLGFLDGRIGFKLAKCASFYEDMVDLRIITSND